MKRTLVLVVIIIAFAVFAIFEFMSDNASKELVKSKNTLPKAGYAAPVVQLPNLQDNILTIGGASDQLVLVNFWASWCGPCEIEMPDIEALSKQYPGKLKVIGINGTSLDKEREARAFVVAQKLTFPIVMDRDGQALESYKVDSFPTSFLIDRHGFVRERVAGVITKEEWDKKIAQWLPQ